jgi:Transport and Golgi organisation 2
MCTVSWIHDKDGYQLLCNRDEKLTRKSAQEPRLAVRNDTRFLAPVDGDFGGTWIATNEYGVSLCLLNGPNCRSAKACRSRGLLVLELIPLSSIAAVSAAVRPADLSVYAPFTLAVLEPGKPAMVIEWDGFQTEIGEHAESHFMLTSSSFDTETVCKSRIEEYVRVSKGVVDADVLLGFHRSHSPAPSAYSTCMHRADAETVSFSRIQVADNRIDFVYSPVAPCKSETALPLLPFHRAQLGLRSIRQHRQKL